MGCNDSHSSSIHVTTYKPNVHSATLPTTQPVVEKTRAEYGTESLPGTCTQVRCTSITD